MSLVDSDIDEDYYIYAHDYLDAYKNDSENLLTDYIGYALEYPNVQNPFLRYYLIRKRKGCMYII